MNGGDSKPTAFRISMMTDEHVRSIAELHHASLTGMLTQLGRPIIEKFYRSALEAEHNIGLVCLDGKVVRGFAFGTMRRAVLYQNIAKKIFPFLAYSLGKFLIKTPKEIYSIWQAVFSKENYYSSECDTELVYLVVHPSYKKLGIGRTLINEFHDILRKNGVFRYELSVDEDNRVALRCYESMGTRITHKYVEFGIPRLRLLAELKREGIQE